MSATLLALLAVLASGPVRPGVPDEHVVGRARLDGREVTVTAGRLRAYAAERGGGEPRALVEALLELELLAARAEARGLARHPEVQEVQAAAAVQAWLRRTFEPSVTEADVPTEMLRRSYRRNIGFYQRPELRAGDHVVVTRGGRRPEPPALDQAARTLAQRIRAELVADPPADADAFAERARRYGAEAEALGLEARVERLGRFARSGPFDPTFNENAFAVTTPGAISPAFATPFGYHVVRISEVAPPVDVPFDQAVPELRARLLPELRAQRLDSHVATLAERFGALVNPEPLRSLDAPLAEPATPEPPPAPER